jgi:hypothetical protein
MVRFIALSVAALMAAGAYAQSPAAKTIEGYWQDVAGRITFKRNALPADQFGNWYTRELDATYPSAKHIRKSDASYQISDLNYDDREYKVRVVRAGDDHIDFERSASWSPCRVRHACRLADEGMFCLLENICLDQGIDVVDWRGEERYIRRNLCLPTGGPQAQGIPVTCK